MERMMYNPNKTMWKAVTVHGHYSLHPAILIDEDLGLRHEGYVLINQATGQASAVDFISILLAEFCPADQIAAVDAVDELPEHTHPNMPRMDAEWLQKFDESFRAMCKRLGWKLIYTEFEAL